MKARVKKKTGWLIVTQKQRLAVRQWAEANGLRVPEAARRIVAAGLEAVAAQPKTPPIVWASNDNRR